jgi:hypothetical protein
VTFRHIVLFRVRDDVGDPELSAALDALRALDATAGASAWRIELSSDSRKGRVIVEDATFASRDAFERFVALPEHRAVGKLMAALSDWWIGDYEE